MKYDITPQDLAIMEQDLKNDRVLKHLRNLSYYKFSVGDVLIRENKVQAFGTNETTWKVELGSGDIPHKYVYVFENELKVGYIRRLSVNGRKFVERSICVTELDPDYTRFKLDPEYADHMLLAGEDAEFDASSRYDELKARREATHRRNKKLKIPMPDVEAAIAWMKTLKVGDQVWWGHSINNLHKEPYFVDQINLYPPNTSLTPWGNQPQDHIKVSTRANPNYSSHIYATSLPFYYVFTQRPHFLDEVVS